MQRHPCREGRGAGAYTREGGMVPGMEKVNDDDGGRTSARAYVRATVQSGTSLATPLAPFSAREAHVTTAWKRHTVRPNGTSMGMTRKPSFLLGTNNHLR